MAYRNSEYHYGAVTKTFHWLTALLMFTVIPLGVIAYDLPYETSEQVAIKAQLFSIHKAVGLSLFFVALARILWAFTQPRPRLLNGDKRAESFLAETVHWVLYSALVLVPLTGWIHHAATEGFAPIPWPFGQSLPFVPKDPEVAAFFGELHKTLQWVLVGAIGLHVAGALKHHFVDRDSTLRRMLPGRVDAPTPPETNHTRWPLVSAVAIWALAIGIGAGLGQDRTQPTTEASLEAVQSDWVVQEGEIEIVVVQLGTPVTGQFADWTAAIRFDETVTDGPAGDVDVTIRIGALSLGSVTKQALGADFFDADTFPTARFQADIFAEDTLAENGVYDARGTLTIKDITQPIEFPFALTLTDGVAQMFGTVVIDRRDFAIGMGMADESSLGFQVTANIALTAARSEQ